MEAVVQNIVMAGAGIAVTAATYVVKKVLDTDKTLAAHTAADAIAFQHFSEHFTRLEAGQTAQSAKLDRLVEHLLEDKP